MADTEPRSPSASVDPSTLTTQQILREVANLEKLLTARMDAIEKAVSIAHADLVRVPTEFDKSLGQLRSIFDERSKTLDERFATMLEKFSSVQTQFKERDVRTEQSAKDTKTAIDAALMAAEKAVGKQQEASDRAIAKSEAAVSKQIESIVALIASNTKASDEKIDDLRARQTRAEGSKAGVAMVISIGVAVVAIVVGASTLLTRASNSSTMSNGAPPVQYVPSAVPVPVPAK